MNDGPVQPNGGLSDSDCEELLAGGRSDLPIGGMLDALRGPLGDQLPGEAAAMAAFRANAAGAVPLGRRGRTPARVVAASIGAGVVLLGGVAAAASGTVRHDIGKFIGVEHDDDDAKAPRETPPVTPAPALTPSAGSATPSPTSTSTSPTGHGKAHGGHGKGKGVGASAQPSHPAHPTKPAHPTQAASPSHPAHPSKKPHPTQASNSAHQPTKANTARPAKKSHPTQAANATRTPRSTNAANSSRAEN